HPLPTGIPGELYVGGKGLARGYLNNPDQTAEVFVNLAQAGNNRLYRTGDRVMWLESGELLYLDRMDNQVKIRGQRVEPDEIAHRLESLDGVEQAIVLPYHREVREVAGNSYDYFVAWYTARQ
ncbi:acyl-CoA synthetase family protein, partial [Sansalvadorimonas verongulae]|uniref:AMP-binding protein n=1 Tax=Sansalvadorimonas verongulae TaxID=2172824 RepID=UPI0012BCF710